MQAHIKVVDGRGCSFIAHTGTNARLHRVKDYFPLNLIKYAWYQKNVNRGAAYSLLCIVYHSSATRASYEKINQ
jgi:hypothetical protein